jgi:hypothetical protein
VRRHETPLEDLYRAVACSIDCIKGRSVYILEATTYLHQWRTLTMNVGGAKGNYLEAEGANLKYFLFCMVKNYK